VQGRKALCRRELSRDTWSCAAVTQGRENSKFSGGRAPQTCRRREKAQGSPVAKRMRSGSGVFVLPSRLQEAMSASRRPHSIVALA